MIFDNLIRFFFSVAYNVLDLIPFMDLEIPENAIDTFMSYVDMAAFFVPIDTIIILLACIIAEELTKIWIALLKFILKFVPFMG